MSRRHLLRLAAMATAAAPLASLLARSAAAADAPMVTADDPTAKTLGYVDDVSKAKAAKPGSKCANCALYTGKAGAASGPCGLFAGKQVSASGWCTAWAAKPS
jgi:hypothetical protein